MKGVTLYNTTQVMKHNNAILIARKQKNGPEMCQNKERNIEKTQQPKTEQKVNY